jgi:hypothetical protein
VFAADKFPTARDISTLAKVPTPSDTILLEKLTQLTSLSIINNPDLTKAQITKAQIDELQKALPNCNIYSNPTK